MKPSDLVVTKNDSDYGLFHLKEPGKIGLIIDRFDHAAVPRSQESEWMDWWVLVDGTIDCHSASNLEMINEVG